MRFAWISAAVLGLTCVLSAQKGPVSAPKIKTGPERGQTIPRIEAPDQNGRMQTLESVAGPKGALVVFYRSADW